jgi:protein-L-isoaspartate(D-aspartate) O-methyltransferase
MTFDFTAARLNMLDGQVRTSDVTDQSIQDAIRVVPREKLCPPGKALMAYADVEIPCGDGQFLMRPRDVSKLLQALRPRSGERALAIAAPYAAAVLAEMGLTVDRLDGGDLASPKGGGYDVIVCEAAVSATPAGWLQALAPGGRLAVVERDGPVGKAKLFVNAESGLATREVFDSSPSMLPGFERRPQFAF